MHSRIWVFLLHPTKDLFYVRWVPGAPKLKLSCSFFEEVTLIKIIY